MREERLENAKKEIRSVIITYPQGVALDAFLKTFQQLVGVRLPSREFGFTSNIDFLHSLPDIVNIQTDRTGNYLLKCVADENTEHIQKLVSKQRVVKPKTKNIYHSQKEERTTNTTSRVKPFVSAALRKNLFEVLKDYPDGLLYQTLLIAYQTKFKRPLNLDFLSDSPHDRLRKLESAVSELHVKMFGDSERLVYSPLTRNVGAKHHVDVTNGIPPLSSPNTTVEKIHLKVKDSKTSDVSVVPKVVKEDFEKVLKLYPDGLLARYFPFLYEKISGVMFDLADLGYNNFLELADALPDIFICVKPFEKPNDWMLFHPCYSKSADKLIKLNEVLELSSERASQMTKLKKQEIPSDVAPYSRPYTPSQFPNDINLSAYIPVFISAATHPGCFWFKLQIEEVICRFRELEEELQ